MAYVTIPKDLSKVQSKVLFGLTKRQVICFGAAAIIGVPLFFVCAPWARSNGCKSRTRPDSGKCIAEQQGCPP